MPQQPRYRVGAPVPGGMVDEAPAQVMESAARLGQKLGGMAYDMANEIGVPKAIERGKIAGQQPGWQPGISFGKIASAYEAAALQANDDKIEKDIVGKANEFITELGPKPGGLNELKGRFDAYTNEALKGVSQQRRDAFIAKRDEIYSLTEQKIREQNTKIDLDMLSASYSKQLDDLFDEQTTAAAAGDRARLDAVNARLQETFWPASGQPYREVNGKEENVPFGELQTLLYNEDGTAKLDENGKPVTYDKLGIHFKTAPLVPMGQLWSRVQKGDEDLTFASYVGVVDRAENKGEMAAKILASLPSSNLPYKSQKQIESAILSILSRNRRMEAMSGREREKESKEFAKVSVSSAIVKANKGELTPSDLESHAARFPFDSEGTAKIYELYKNQHVIPDEESIRLINEYQNAGQYDRANNLIEASWKGGLIDPQNYRDLSDLNLEAQTKYNNSPANHPVLAKPVFDVFESKMQTFIGKAVMDNAGLYTSNTSQIKAITDMLKDAFNRKVKASNIPTEHWEKEAKGIVDRFFDHNIQAGLKLSMSGASVDSALDTVRSRIGYVSQEIGILGADDMVALSPFFYGEIFDKGMFDQYIADPKNTLTDAQKGELIERRDRIVGALESSGWYLDRVKKSQEDSKNYQKQLEAKKAQLQAQGE